MMLECLKLAEIGQHIRLVITIRINYTYALLLLAQLETNYYILIYYRMQSQRDASGFPCNYPSRLV